MSAFLQLKCRLSHKLVPVTYATQSVSPYSFVTQDMMKLYQSINIVIINRDKINLSLLPHARKPATSYY